MKVLQINATYGVGSTGVIVKDIHELALKEGIESYVAYSSSRIPEGEIVNGYKIGSTFEKKLHAFLCRINGMQGYFSRHSTRKFLKYLKKIKPDIVQLHNLHSNYINLPMLLKHLASENIKTIVTLHDCWFFTGGCFHYTSAGCDKWKQECGCCPKKREDTKAFLFDRSAKILRDRYRLFDAIEKLTVVGVSDWITKEAVKSVFKGRKAVTIHNGVDTLVFRAEESDFREVYRLENKFIILGPASKWLSLINKNNFEIMVKSLNDDEIFVLLGCSEQQISELPKGVMGLPFIRNKDDLCKIYTAADVFVNSTREDTLPFANLEPQACGTPVITYRNTGAKETVDEICGFSVDARDCVSLRRLVDKIKSIGSVNFNFLCRDFINEKFHQETQFFKYIQLYNEVLN